MNLPEVKNVKLNRNLPWRAYLENNSNNNRRIFNNYRNKAKSVMGRKRARFCASNFEGCSQTEIWKRLKSSGVIGDEVATADIDIEEFNRNSILPEITPNINFLIFLNARNNGFIFRNVDIIEIYNAMMSIKSNAVGPDGMPLKFLKFIFQNISRPLMFILNNVITTSHFPESWKIGRITTVPKIKSPKTTSDYRPIRVLNASSIILEVLLRNQLQQHMEDGNYLNRYQSGFRKYFNTTGLVLDSVEQLRTNLDKKIISALIFLDFSKAFDSISHYTLCDKLFIIFFLK